MRKQAHCSSCNRTYTVEDRVVGKLITACLLSVVTALTHKAVKRNPVVYAAVGAAGLALGHWIDVRLGLRCQTPGCTAVLTVIEAPT